MSDQTADAQDAATDDPEQAAADAQADAAQTSGSARAKVADTAIIGQILNQGSLNDPNERSLIAQYGVNAQQARDILQKARDTLVEQTPQLQNAAMWAGMKGFGGGDIASNMTGAALGEQQSIQKQLMDYDLMGNQANKGSLDAQLKLLTDRYGAIGKLGPAAVRGLNLPEAQQQKGAAGTAGQFAEMLGYKQGTPEYKSFIEEQALGGADKLPPITKVTNLDGSTSLFMETRDANGVHVTPVHAPGTGTGQNGRSGLTGDDFLTTLPPTQASQVKALAEGRMAFPSGFALKSPYWQNMLSSVSQYDPQFDAVNYNARSKTRNDFTSGTDSDTTSRINTAIGHLGTLYGQIGGTASHGGFPLATTVNAVQNAFMSSSGNPGVPLFKDTAGKLAQELTAVYRGSGGAESDVVRSLQSLDPDASLETKKAVLGNAVE